MSKKVKAYVAITMVLAAIIAASEIPLEGWRFWLAIAAGVSLAIWAVNIVIEYENDKR